MPFDNRSLPAEYPRSFVPANANLGDWQQIEHLFDELERRPLATMDALEKWILDGSELSAALEEEGAVRYIRMTSQTDNLEFEKAFLDFVENIEPKIKPRAHKLGERFLASPARILLPRERYLVLDRRIANAVALFRPENVPLEVELEKLSQSYQKIAGAMTVQYDGREQTIQQMAKCLEVPDGRVRQETWELVEKRRFQDREKINELYDKMVALRDQLARNAGFLNFRDYAFLRRERFDYTPEDCFAFHQAVEKYAVPLRRELQKARQKKLGVEMLRPWDLFVDPEGRPPLRPFENPGELVAGCRKIFRAVDPELAGFFDRIADLGLLDLDSRKGKAPGGYQAYLAERRLPFIFTNAVGRDNDMRTMLHESGHSFHTFLTRDEPINDYRNPPLEFAEVASMAMDLIAAEYVEAFYKPEEKLRSQREHLDNIVRLLPWVATIDSFQHWVYTNPKHTTSEREEYWLELHRRFGGLESWEGYVDALRNMWQRQQHLFTAPFYYIEYGIAQLGALGLWLKWRKNPSQAIADYKRGLSVGGSKPLPELFAAAGLRFDFGPDTLKPIVGELRAVLAH